MEYLFISQWYVNNTCFRVFILFIVNQCQFFIRYGFFLCGAFFSEFCFLLLTNMYCPQKTWWGTGEGSQHRGIICNLQTSTDFPRLRILCRWPTLLSYVLYLLCLDSYSPAGRWGSSYRCCAGLRVPRTIFWFGTVASSFLPWFLPTFPSHLVVILEESLHISSWLLALFLVSLSHLELLW